MWPNEDIPDDASLFMRVHRLFTNSGQLGPNAFRDHGHGMSVDWSKYSTADETRNRARSPKDNAVISMGVAAVRAIEGLAVEHAPIQEGSVDAKGTHLIPNRAHAEVMGEKTTERRLKLSRIWTWEIRAPEEL